MNAAGSIYRPSLLLLADLYELTMACGYWKLGRETDQAVFHLFFRSNAFNGGYTVAAGLGYAVDYLSNLRVEDADAAYLRSLRGADGEPLFDPAFVEYLSRLEFSLDVDAVPEGTVVFPFQPLVRVVGPILQCQIVESALLNMINFQTLVRRRRRASATRRGGGGTRYSSSDCGAPRASTARSPRAAPPTSAAAAPRRTCSPGASSTSRCAAPMRIAG